MNNNINKKELDILLKNTADINSQVIYFPVRHHSPVCSLKLQEIIENFKPEYILIEGPSDFNDKIDLLTDENTISPFAIYSFYNDLENKLGKNGILTAKPEQPARYRCWYPFADYSPELVALREGKKKHIEAKFIDLPYRAMLYAERSPESLENDSTPSGKNIFDDYLIERSIYVKLLCKKTGCRDYNDLWDNLFEIKGINMPPIDFMKSLITFCYLSRVDYTDEMLQAEGCMERENSMASYIIETIKTGKKILVVTGGFHTVKLWELVKNKAKTKKTPPPSDKEAGSYLVPFSFELMDSHRGYESGMPSPAYYQDIWEEIQKKNPEPFTMGALKKITEIGIKAKKDGEIISTAEAIEAFSMSGNLSSFRLRNEISRMDILDSIRSTFIKGAISDGAFTRILNITNKILTGNKIGKITDKAGRPPIIDDFYVKLKNYGFKELTGERKGISLDLYRKESHRRKSRFLHQITFLEIPFAYCIQGPDFVKSKNLNLIFERWEYFWRPEIESYLTDKAIYGNTIFDSATSLLIEKINNIEHQSGEGTGLLLKCCHMGLNTHINTILNKICPIIENDEEFLSIVQAINNLCLIFKYRDILETKGLESLIPVIDRAYKKGIYLLEELPKVNENKEREILEGLKKLNHIVISLKELPLDKELYLESLKRGLNTKEFRPLIKGAFMGALYGCGEIPEKEILKIFSGYLNSSPEHVICAADFLEGILSMAKHIFFENSMIFKELNSFFNKSDDDTFFKVLPGLRRAFTGFTPREIELIGNNIAKYLGVSRERIINTGNIPPAVTIKGMEIDRKVSELITSLGIKR